MAGEANGRDDEDTATRIVMAELRSRARALGKDIREHDEQIEQIRADISGVRTDLAVVRSELRTVMRVVAWGMGAVGTAVVGGVVAALAKLYSH